MRLLPTWSAIIVLGFVVTEGPVASAGPGLTLGRGQLNATVAAEFNMSSGAIAQPASLAPDVSYGVSDTLTLALVHSTFATTGFRGSAGRGLCVSGSDNGCAKIYDNAGAEATLSLAQGPLAAAALLGFHALSLDAGFYAAKVGAKARYTIGPWSVTTSPSLFIGLTERDTNKESLWIPVLAQYRVAPPLALGLGTGLKGPIDGLGDRWEVALGASGVYALSPTVGVGAAWTFGKIVGGADATGLDYRAVHLWCSLTR